MQIAPKAPRLPESESTKSRSLDSCSPRYKTEVALRRWRVQNGWPSSTLVTLSYFTKTSEYVQTLKKKSKLEIYFLESDNQSVSHSEII